MAYVPLGNATVYGVAVVGPYLQLCCRVFRKPSFITGLRHPMAYVPLGNATVYGVAVVGPYLQLCCRLVLKSSFITELRHPMAYMPLGNATVYGTLAQHLSSQFIQKLINLQLV